jgi:hypothetical protein
LFVRVAPFEQLVLMAEGDLVIQSPHALRRTTGYVTMLQADIEPIQGLHAVLTGENQNLGGPSEHTSWGGWFGVAWFFAPHADLRADFMRRQMAVGSDTLAVTAIMGQIHVFL